MSRARAIHRRLEAAEFDPRHVPDLVFWTRGGWSPVTLNGSNIAQWSDISGNGSHATQVTEADQPAYSATAVNGRPGAVGDATTDYLSADAVSTIASGTDKEFTLFLTTAINSLGARQSLVSFGRDASGTPLFTFEQESTNVWRSSIRDDATTAKAVTGGTVTAANFNHLIIVSGGTLTWRVNGSVAINAGDVDVGAITLDNFSIFALNRGGTIENHSDAGIAEIGAYSRALTASEITLLETYQTARSGF